MISCIAPILWFMLFCLSSFFLPLGNYGKRSFDVDEPCTTSGVVATQNMPDRRHDLFACSRSCSSYSLMGLSMYIAILERIEYDLCKNLTYSSYTPHSINFRMAVGTVYANASMPNRIYTFLTTCVASSPSPQSLHGLNTADRVCVCVLGESWAP